MAEKEIHTEDKIIEAAREVFIEKGMVGARMQEIADKAGINKSLLHYYFRSKEKLFDAILSQVIGGIGSMFGLMMHEDVNIENKLKLFINTYIEVFQKNPFLPNFILNEINRNPDGIMVLFAKAKIEPKKFFDPLDKQLKAEGYSIHPQDFMINILSMTIFPVAIKPILEQLLFEGDEKQSGSYLISQKESVLTFMMNALSGYKI